MMENENNPSDQASPSWSSSRAPLFGVTLALMMVVAIGSYALRGISSSRDNSDCYEQENPPVDQAPKDYTQWEKPLVALILSGQMHGFIDPCGCSEPQYGGLIRRFNFIQSLKAKSWDVVGIDMGELPHIKGIHEQNLLKYDLSIKALSAMDYRAVGIGRNEMLLPLGEGLAQIWDKKKPYPRLLNLTLGQTAPGQQYHDLNVRPYEIIDHTTPKIGVVNLMGHDLRDKLEPLKEKFLFNQDELPKALKAFADAGVEIGVILHHEYPVVDKNIPAGFKQEQAIENARRELAVKCVKFCDAERKKNPKIPPIHLIMVLTELPEPSALMRPIDPKPTQLVEIGHKGKYVGLLGVYRAGKAYRLQYQMVLMSPEWQTKKGQEKNNAVIALMEDYNQELKRHDMLAKFPRSLHHNQIPEQNQKGLKATYVGSKRCGDCHDHAWKVWAKTPHFGATQTLEDLKHPSGRHYDPECMMCHTTGFKHPGGYNDPVAGLAAWPPPVGLKPNPKQLHKLNDKLRGVGCESCHGPGSEHEKHPDDAKLYDLINPYRPSKAERALEEKVEMKTITPQQAAQLAELFKKRIGPMGANLCMKCHDGENDVNWGQPGKDTADKWRGGKHPLIHRTPRNNNGAGDPPPAKGNNPPAVVIDPGPPIVIEIIQEKKK
jgi:hypothetical protein